MYTREIDNPRYEIAGALERYDEADNAQARGELIPDSQLWRAYYQQYPELENQVRESVQNSALARKLAIRNDRLFRRSRTETPFWLEPQPKTWIKELRRKHPFKKE